MYQSALLQLFHKDNDINVTMLRLLVCNKQKLQCARPPVSLAINQPTNKKMDAYGKKEVIGGLRQSW